MKLDIIESFITQNQLNLSTNSRIMAANYILSNNINATNFIHIIYNVSLKQKIVWFHVLDWIIEKDTTYLNPILDIYLQKGLIETHESIKRCVSRSIYHQLKSDINIYSKQQKEQIIQTMFDWILLPSLVATRVNAIHVLYFLINEESWIKEQLIAIIEQNMLLKEASFLSRGKKILKLLHKQKS